MGCSKSSYNREAYSNTILPQEIRKTSYRQPNFTPKTTGKRKTNKQTKKKTQNQQKERNHKDPRRNKGKRNENNNSKD